MKKYFIYLSLLIAVPGMAHAFGGVRARAQSSKPSMGKEQSARDKKQGDSAAQHKKVRRDDSDIWAQFSHNKPSKPASKKEGFIEWCKNAKNRVVEGITSFGRSVCSIDRDDVVNTVLFAATMYCLYHNRIDIGVMIWGGRYLLSNPVIVGVAPCQGKEEQVIIPVDDAGVPPVVGAPAPAAVFKRQIVCPEQNGMSCGYHAARNTMTIVDGFLNNRIDLQARLDNEASVNAVIGGAASPWRAMVNQAREHQQAVHGGNRRPGTNWLDSEEIQRILADQRDNDRLGFGVPFDPDAHITIIDNVAYFAMADVDAGNIGVQLAQHRRRAAPVGGIAPLVGVPVGVEYVHGFVLGNMQQRGDKMGSKGHWISVVLHQKPDGGREYIVTDSNGNRPALDCAPVRALIANLEGPAGGPIPVA